MPSHENEPGMLGCHFLLTAIKYVGRNFKQQHLVFANLQSAKIMLLGMHSNFNLIFGDGS